MDAEWKSNKDGGEWFEDAQDVQNLEDGWSLIGGEDCLSNVSSQLCVLISKEIEWFESSREIFNEWVSRKIQYDEYCGAYDEETISCLQPSNINISKWKAKENSVVNKIERVDDRRDLEDVFKLVEDGGKEQLEINLEEAVQVSMKNVDAHIENVRDLNQDVDTNFEDAGSNKQNNEEDVGNIELITSIVDRVFNYSSGLVN